MKGHPQPSEQPCPRLDEGFGLRKKGNGPEGGWSAAYHEARHDRILVQIFDGPILVRQFGHVDGGVGEEGLRGKGGRHGCGKMGVIR